MHYIHTMKHPALATMLGVVGSDDKRMPPYWLPQGFKTGQNEYLEILKTVVKLWVDANYKNIDYVWQQDSPLDIRPRKRRPGTKRTSNFIYFKIEINIFTFKRVSVLVPHPVKFSSHFFM